MPPDISIIIPAYNRSEMLLAAIESCRRSAAGLDVEIIVIDDASKEDIAAAVAGSGVRLERQAKNAGSAVARNRGLELAQSAYIKFLDSDDVLVENALSREHGVATQNDADIVVAGWIETAMDDVGAEAVLSTHPAPRFKSIVDDLLAGRAVPTSSALYHARVAQQVCWDPELSKLNDWDYFLSAAARSEKIVSLGEPAYRWRHHGGERITTSATFLSNAREFFIILEKFEAFLVSTGQFTPARRQRMAQYLYKELRGAYRFEPALGRRILGKILALDPGFIPRDEEHSRTFRIAYRLLPPDWILSGYGFGRRAMDRVLGVHH
jgi:glycosyltransferase involved in cell wall biosynthesis